MSKSDMWDEVPARDTNVPTNPPTEDKDLFWDNFGEWLEAHGVTLGDWLPDTPGFAATIDLNELKVAIIKLGVKDGR